jgi:hypothetical protein
MFARRLFLSLTALLALILVAACFGGDDDDAAEGEDADVTATGEADETQAGDNGDDDEDDGDASPTEDSDGSGDDEPSATPEDGDDDGSGDGDDDGDGDGGDEVDADDFRELTEGQDELTYSVTYEVLGSGTEGEDMGFWTIAQDPPKRAVILSFEGSEDRFWLIEDGENSYTCYEADGEGVCLESGPATGDILPPGADIDETVDEAEESTSIREIDGRTIAGRDARCFEYDDANGDSGTMCLDEENGVLLLLEGEGFSMTAQEVSTDVDPGVFEPPFDITDLSP